MKLLYVLPYPKFFTQHKRVGGHIAHCIGILKAFKNKNFGIRYFSEESDPLLVPLNIETSTFSNRYKSFWGRQLWLFHFIRKLKREVKESRPDLVYMRYSTSVSFWYPFIRRAVGSTPFILEVNSLGSQRVKPLSFFDKRFLRTATSVIAISSILGEYIRGTLGVSATVVPNGIDAERIPEDLVRGNPSGKKIAKMVYAGLLKPSYGLEFIVSSIDEIRKVAPNLELELYGDGPLFPVLKEMAQTRPWVKLPGPVDFNSIPQKLASADILLYPTSHFNRFQSPTKLFEYMAAARPIVAAKTEQTEKLLINGKLGYLFQLDSLPDLKKAVMTVLSDYKSARHKAMEARKEVLSNYSWDSRLDMILNTIPDFRRP